MTRIGYKQTKEHKRKIGLANSISHKGIKLSDEHKIAFRVPHKGSGIYIRTNKNSGKSKGKHWKLSEETKEKIRQAMTGSNNYAWIEDRTKLKTERQKSYDTQYKYWMLEVKGRDSWKCRLSNQDCKGRLEAHHILNWEDFPELRYDVRNGITLCHFHHPRGRANEAKLSPYLQSLVADIQ